MQERPTRSRGESFVRTCSFAAVMGIAWLSASPASARITRIVITSTESPTFAGTSFGSVGQYEKLRGTAYGEVDPEHSRNSVIADLALAPRNAAGRVEYATDFVILRPVDRSKGNRRVFYEINNRGSLYALNMLNDASSGGNDPTTAADAGNGFLMRQGYTIVASGWDTSAASGGSRLTITVPVARNNDGTTITGDSLEEFVIDNATTLTGSLTYPAADTDTSRARLSVRFHTSDTPAPVPGSGWEYVNAQTIRLLPSGTAFAPGTLYELVYPAKDPKVVGLSFAAVRDLVSFLRYATVDDLGAPNPAGGVVERVYSFSFSQPSRWIRQFVHTGFNADLGERTVFDGNLNWIGGGSGGSFNHRFAQPFRTHRQHIGRWYPELQFPFANVVTDDPVTGKRDGIMDRCRVTRTCPLVFEVNSSNEYWAKSGSLLHTSPLGTWDLPDPENVRTYLLASLPHNSGTPVTGLGPCSMPRNPLVANRTLRALLVRLDEWTSAGGASSAGTVAPPPGQVPRLDGGTLVPTLPRAGIGFPAIPGVTYTGLAHTAELFDFGPDFESRGVWGTVPPAPRGSPYATLVPKTDEDGNDVAGIRVVEVAVPTATYTGWNTRSGPASPDGCDAAGMKIDFPKTKADRAASGDPRRAIQERYASHQDYVAKVTDAARALQLRGLLLEEDVARYIDEASQSSVGN